MFLECVVQDAARDARVTHNSARLHQKNNGTFTTMK